MKPEYSFIKSLSGYIYALIFCVMTAISVTLIHHSNQKLDPLTTLFFSCLFTIVFFNVINHKNLPNTYKKIVLSKYDWLKISVSVAVNWLATFLALISLSPYVFVFCYFNASSIIGSYIELKRDNSSKNITLFIVSLLLFFLFIMYNNSLFHHIKNMDGFILTIISAFFGYIYRRYSVNFNKHANLSASQVLSIRFYLLLIIAFAGAKWSLLSSINVSDIFIFILITAFTFVLPLYCMQKSVLIIGAEKFSIFSSLCPAITALLMLTLQETNISWTGLSLALLFFVVSIYKILPQHPKAAKVVI